MILALEQGERQKNIFISDTNSSTHQKLIYDKGVSQLVGKGRIS